MRTRLRGDRSREDDLPNLPLLSAPRTPFNASIGPHRRFAYTTLSLEDARQIRRAFGVTFNDVVMALCAATLRKYLQLHDALPADPLVAMVPISVRRPDEGIFFATGLGATSSLPGRAEPVKRLMPSRGDVRARTARPVSAGPADLPSSLRPVPDKRGVCSAGCASPIVSLSFDV